MDAPNNQVSTINLIECPRDAMQGWKKFIPTKKKIEYINSLLKVGFHTIDFGSFVSPKAIPQMADTKEVIPNLALENSKTKLLAIVANLRGAEEAIQFKQIHYLGFPFSIFLSDCRFGARLLLKSPVTSIAAILSLALGIGGTTTMLGARL